MRLGEWRAATPSREAMGPRVVDLLGDVLQVFGTGDDPECWVAWGDEPAVRWTLLVPTPGGLVVAHVRVGVPQLGPRVSAKLVRWKRVEQGEFALQTTESGHLLVTGSVERVVLRGLDDEARAIGRFLAIIIAAEDGRWVPGSEPTVSEPSVEEPAVADRPPATQASRGTPATGGS